MEKDPLFSYIETRWANEVSGHLAKVIAERVMSLRPQEADCLSYPDLLSMVGRRYIDRDFQAALTILTAGKHALLRAYGVYVDEDGNEYPLRGEDFTALLSENVLVHPQTGEVVENAAQHVAPVFEKAQEDR
ncbi:hypothetical protein [Paracoccus rhizosphaerae]|uniref:Uncharacterized protein n=1 Tax=Paracoccus rhizosphaerae TaxID=1133347 RepID=A0ABV6CIK3_9RHOB|nr:hypothetical protein [Paracoccus rhizosphaerae]